MVFSKEKIKHLQERDPAQLGALENVKLFSHYENRSKLYIAGVHGKREAGIHGRQGEGAFSVVIAGRYDDDEDHGDIIVYTGEGGHSRDTEMQTQDQAWVRGNAALRMSHLRKLPVRVVRSSVLRSKYAPASGYRYDGLYRVTEAEQAVGRDGHAICRFVLERLPNQAPLPEFGKSGSSGRAGRAHPGPSETSTSRSRSQQMPVSVPKVERPTSRKKSTLTSHGITFKFEGSFSPPKPEPGLPTVRVKAESPTPRPSSSRRRPLPDFD